jgi:transcription elongation factor Elf1
VKDAYASCPYCGYDNHYRIIVKTNVVERKTICMVCDKKFMIKVEFEGVLTTVYTKKLKESSDENIRLASTRRPKRLKKQKVQK